MEIVITKEPNDYGSFEILAASIKNKLQGRKFLLVMDDVWSEGQAANLVFGVTGEVESIRDELRLVQSSMELVEDMEEPGEDKVTWARIAESTLSEVEDVVDIFQSKRARYLRRGALKKTLLWLPLECDRVNLRNRAKKIRDQIQDLSNTRPVQLSNPPDLLAISPGIQATYHSASIVVSSAMNEISLCLSQKLLMNRQVRKIVEDTRNEFERLHRSILVDLKGETCVDERARAWTDQVKDISHFTYHTFSSFINKMKRKNVFLLLEDYSFGKIIQVIKSRVLGLYKRKWIFGIGYVETNSTSMVSVVSRLSSGYTFRSVIAPEALTQQSTKQLEWIMGDLSLMEALFNDVDGIEENLDKRLAVWLEQMRKISEDLRDEQKLETLTTRRIITMGRQINKKLSDMSERKWTYDIGKIEGRRYSGSSSNRGGLEKISSARRPILSEPMESLQNEVELMNAMIEDAQSHEGGLDVRLKVWLGQMQDIAADANELLRKTDRIRCGFSNSMVTREIDIINRRVQWISRRKWLYDIGGIRGRRSTDASGSGKSFQMLVGPVFYKLNILKLLYTNLGGSFVKLSADVELIQRESSLLHALLEDVEPSDKRVKAWLNQVSDVNDEMGAAISYCCVHPKSIDRPKIAKKMALILDKARDVMERRIKFGIELNQKNEKSASSMNRYLSVAESYTFDKLKNTGRNVNILQAVIEQLLVQNEECIVVPVVGIKGIGKTTLAQLIYNNDIVARHFPFHALVSIPSDCYTDENLNRIVEEALSRHRKLEKGGLVEADYGKQVLIVLDEVRTTDIWDILIKKLKSIFDGRRMALIVTTSDVAVAVHADPKSTPHKLQLLNDDDSWALFTQSLIVPEGLMERSKKLVVKCGGFPQMIMELRERFTMLGSSTNEWMKVLDTPNLGQGPWETTQKVIKGLPLSLKRCLLYLTQFPTDFEIPLRRLTLLWLAEGILHQWWDEGGLESPESVAERYMTELADRCLVQVTKRNLHGEVLKCRLPHVLRELLSSGYEKAESKDLKSSLSSSNIRHLVHFERKQDGTSGSFHSCITDLSASGISQYQSVISFRSFDNREGNQSGVDLGKFLDRCISSRTFLLMRVLDLEHVFRPVLPKALGALVLLKYLGLRWTYLESLPSFMSKLLNLQTLDLKHTSISRLPDSIWKMGQLRHLFLDEYYHCRFVRRPSRYSLPHLQTLWNVFIDEDSPVKGGLDSSINLTRLGVECRLMSLRKDTMLSQLKAVANWVQNLKELKSLRLKSFDKCGKPWTIPLQTLSGQKKLCSLYLLGRVQKDLVISGLPLTLTELTLSGSGLEDDPMQLLKTLTNLRSLSLFSDSFVGKQMLCSEGFAQLQFLKIWKLENLEEWKVESGALSILGDLEIRSCKRLKTFPDELQNSKTLQKLNFSDMPEEWDEIRETFFARHEENAEDKYDVTHTPASIFSPTQAKTVQRRNEIGEPSYGTSSMSGNISASLSAGEPSHYKRTKSDNTAASLSSGAFVQLQILKIRKLDKHEEWNADRAFQTITDVDISSCKGNEKTMADKYEVARTPVPILSSIKEKIEMQKLRMSQKLFLKKLASEELEMHPWECPFCGVERESAIHLFFLCTPIKMVWFSNYGVKTNDFSNLSISEWIDHILTPTLLYGGILPNQGDFIRFSVTLMETIWSWRNKFISGAAQTFHPDMIHKNASSSFTSALYIRE